MKTLGKTHQRGNALFYFVILFFLHFCKCKSHSERTSIEEEKINTLEIPYRKSAAISSKYFDLVHRPMILFAVSNILHPSPFPSHFNDTFPPLKKDRNKEERKELEETFNNVQGQTGSHYHNSGNNIIASQKASHKLKRSNRSITWIS